MGKMYRRRDGFTLIELIVVIAILGIIAAITVPLMNSYISDANQSSASSQANVIANTISRLMLSGTNVTNEAIEEESNVGEITFYNESILNDIDTLQEGSYVYTIDEASGYAIKYYVIAVKGSGSTKRHTIYTVSAYGDMADYNP